MKGLYVMLNMSLKIELEISFFYLFTGDYDKNTFLSLIFTKL